jgi:serine/threonine protein kinase
MSQQCPEFPVRKLTSNEGDTSQAINLNLNPRASAAPDRERRNEALLVLQRYTRDREILEGVTDELGWENQDPLQWMETLDVETRIRLTQIPSGWSRFSTCHPIAGGGCGKICVSNDGQLNRQVVIKKINPELLNSQAIKRFLSEARITAQLEHPGIAPVYELGVDDQGLPFYAMKQLSGKTLTQYLSELTAMPNGRKKDRTQRELLQRLLSVCQTMAFAHQRGVIHRDLKPDNIMLGQFGETTVVDWGLARSGQCSEKSSPTTMSDPSPSYPAHVAAVPDSTGALTVQGMVMGTAAYMSPEQAQGMNDRVDQRSDVFSLGVILFELMTGHSPFAAHSLPKTIENVIACNRNELARRLHSCPRPLAWICLKSMSPSPEDRYESANELAQDLQSCLAGQPIAGLNESCFEMLDRWASNHRTAFRGLLVTLLGLMSACFIVANVAGESEIVETLPPIPSPCADVHSPDSIPREFEALQRENSRLKQQLADMMERPFPLESL